MSVVVADTGEPAQVKAYRPGEQRGARRAARPRGSGFVEAASCLRTDSRLAAGGEHTNP
jgi:hypothetical protein